MRDPIQTATYLDDLAATQYSADKKGANALRKAAHLLRVGSDEEPTEPRRFLCAHCGMLNDPEAP